jgi:hypothetical protein
MDARLPGELLLRVMRWGFSQLPRPVTLSQFGPCLQVLRRRVRQGALAGPRGQLQAGGSCAAGWRGAAGLGAFVSLKRRGWWRARRQQQQQQDCLAGWLSSCGSRGGESVGVDVIQLIGRASDVPPGVCAAAAAAVPGCRAPPRCGGGRPRCATTGEKSRGGAAAPAGGPGPQLLARLLTSAAAEPAASLPVGEAARCVVKQRRDTGAEHGRGTAFTAMVTGAPCTV